MMDEKVLNFTSPTLLVIISDVTEVQDPVMMSGASELYYHFIEQNFVLNVWLCLGIFQSDIINHPQKVGLEKEKNDENSK